jgi:hypothetical protein
MKYKLHIPFGSTEELLCRAVNSVRPISNGNIHIWSGLGRSVPSDVTLVWPHEIGVVTIVSLINMCIQESMQDDVMFICHDDAYVHDGVALDFLHFVENIHSQNIRWGAVFSHYDVFAAYNMTAVRDVGWWDTMFFQYMADNDYYHRLRIKGWPIIDFGARGVDHFGSSVVKLNSLHNHITRFRNSTNFDNRYYTFKWGGKPGSEKFTEPFGGVV